MSAEAVDVVIVGAGPTGLLLAVELTLAGVHARVVERRTEPDLSLKAGGIGALAAEVLARRGLGPAIEAEEAAALAQVKAMSASVAASDGNAPPSVPSPIVGNFGGLFLIDQALQREPARCMRGVTQVALERILAAHAEALGVEVRRGCEVDGFEDTGDRVRVDVRGAQGRQRLDAAFLVGCDGGRSAVRKQAGFDFPGTAPTLTGRQGIVDIDHPERLLPLGWTRTPRGMMAYGPRPGRLSVIEFDGPPADRDLPLTSLEFEDALRRVSGADVRITALRSGTRWTDHARQSSTYRRGRVLLAGDAAHIHSPFGGQGLNLGLLDATNLGWKLAATLRGDAPEGLLDTYTRERHPVAARVLDNTRAQLALMRPDPQTEALRRIVADLMTSYPDVNRHLGEMISGVDTRYDLGEEDPLVGQLVADRPMAVDGGVTTLYAQMRDGRALLLNAGDEVGEDELRRRPGVRAMSSPGVPPMLVRPDGCIAWAGRAGRLPAALARCFLPRDS